MAIIKLRPSSPEPSKSTFIEHPVVAGILSGVISGIVVTAITPYIPVYGVWISQNASALTVGIAFGVIVGSLTIGLLIKSGKR